MPRTCVFEVGGEIRLSRALRVRSPYLTIAGQSAPSPGITITRAGLAIQSHDVLVQHVSFRVGDDTSGPPPQERDGISIGAASTVGVFNVVLSNVSVTWAIDENISTWYPTTRDVTITRSIIAEGLDKSIHPKGPHSKGLMIGDGTKRVTASNNLIAFNIERNPYLKPGSTVEFVGNAVYGWGPKGGWSLCNLSDNAETGEPVLLAFVRNFYKPGPESIELPPIYAKKPADGTRVFVLNNIGPGRASGSGDEWSIASIPVKHRSAAIPFPESGAIGAVTVVTLEDVLRNVGSRPRDRDAIDSRVIQEVRQGRGRIKDCVTSCSNATGGWPDWKRSVRSFPRIEDPHGDRDANGYTNLEDELHAMARGLEY